VFFAGLPLASDLSEDSLLNRRASPQHTEKHEGASQGTVATFVIYSSLTLETLKFFLWK
jgi:hypothetical protein